MAENKNAIAVGRQTNAMHGIHFRWKTRANQ